MGFALLILFIAMGMLVGIASAINDTFLTYYLYGWATIFVLSGIVGYLWR